MSSPYQTLKRKIEKAADEGGATTLEQLDNLIYRKYSTGQITRDEYNSLCFMLETKF